MDDKKKWCFDVEVYINFFCVTFKDVDSEEVVYYEISERRDDIEEIIKFQSRIDWLIGFNSYRYDNLILMYLVRNYEVLKHLQYFEVTKAVKNLSNSIIDSQDNPLLLKDIMKKYGYRLPFQFLDLFLYWSKMLRISKKLSLKSIAINMNWHKIQELPIAPDSEIKLEEMDLLKEYNLNDVLITEKLYFNKLEEISLRQNIQKQYGLECLNKDAPKIASELLAKSYGESKGLEFNDFKDKQTKRNTIVIEDCILPEIEFDKKPVKVSIGKKGHKTFNNSYGLLEELKRRVVSTTTEMSYSIIQDNGISGVLKSDYGSGGIHGVADFSIIEENESHIIITSDIESMYPSLIVEHNFVPQHLGSDFLSVYKNIKEKRLEAKRNGDKVTSDVLKLVLNSSFGMINNDYSWLKDSKTVLQITLNGQLIITKLTDECIKNGIKVLLQNTDGIEVYLPREKEALYYDIVKNVETQFKVRFEHGYYKKLIVKDINNYIAQDRKGKIKEKGMFLTNPSIDMSRDYLIIPIALQAYFLEGIPVEKTIRSHQNIYSFTCAQKVD